MKKKCKVMGTGFLASVFLFFLLLSGPAGAADDFFLYGEQGSENITEADAPVVSGTSWFTATEYFRDGIHEGKMLAATGKSIYIQAAEGSSNWIKVAEVVNNMDPCFIRISPSGEKVALGTGYMKDLLVFDTSLLDQGTPETPVDLINSDQVNKYDEIYYDAAWVGETHLVINGGWWVDYPRTSNSGISLLDVTIPGGPDNMAKAVCGIIPGASSGIAVDSDNNLYFGIGQSQTRTGEIKVFPASSWWTGSGGVGTMMGYDDDEANGSFIIAAEVLSAAYLGFDGEGNFHVGGGQFVENQNDPTGEEIGFVSLISHKHMEAARAHILDPAEPFTPLDETRGSLYRELYSDPCMDDTAMGIMANGSNLTVVWNGNDGGCKGIIGDWWYAGVQPVMTTYHVDAGRDGDSDGVYDVADYSPNTYDPDNIDSDGDGYGNIIDADFNNDDIVDLSDMLYFRNNFGSADSTSDMNSDGIVDLSDMLLFRSKYGKTAPYYE